MEFFSIFLGNSYDEIGAYSQERTLGAKGGLGPPAQRKKNFGPPAQRNWLYIFFLSRVTFLSFKNLDPFLISLAQLVTTNHLTKRTKKKKKNPSPPSIRVLDGFNF